MQKFHPKYMKMSVLTAALQELTPRAQRDADPDLAVEEWLASALEIGSPPHPAFGRSAPQ